MKSVGRSKWSCISAAWVMAAAVTVASASDSSSIRFPLQTTGVDTNAVGTVTAVLGSRSSQFMVRASNLTPGQNYTLTVGNIAELTKPADRGGRWTAMFRTPPRASTPALDFDPRGQVVALADGTSEVLQGLVSRPGEPVKSSVNERVEFVDGRSKASLFFQTLATGRRIFTVRLSGVSGSNWVIYVNGQLRGPVNVRGRSGLVIFDSSPGSSSSRKLLDFDPRGFVVDIAQDTNLVFTGKMEASCKGVNFATPSVQTAFIPSTGVDPNGTARAKFRIDPDARRKFSIELEDVPVGAYDLIASSVNGIQQFTLNVVNTVNGTEGEIEFSGRENSGDELPLTFDPLISTFTVQLGTVVYFQGGLTFGSVSGSEPPALIEESLSSTRLDSDASGHAKYEIRDTGRRDFSVEIEDVNAGAYQLWVGGTMRGSISAQLKNGQVKGELEFSSPGERGKGLLNFDPRGQLIEVKTAAGTFFSHLYDGSGNGGGGHSVSLIPILINLPLFNTGVSPNASAHAEYKRDDRGRPNFEIEIEAAPAGSYSLIVGGVQRATIAVVSEGNGSTRGQVEFDDSPKPGQSLLDFDPLGKMIALVRDDQTYFAREFPATN